MSNSLVADVRDLKSRLEWGRPAFTVIDTRDRLAYNQGHIIGAISVPLDQLEDCVLSTLHRERRIYIYGDNQAQSALAVRSLQLLGFKAIAVLNGGLQAWKTIGGAVEGTAA
jgi:rhodanese-related sulfurtransferase